MDCEKFVYYKFSFKYSKICACFDKRIPREMYSIKKVSLDQSVISGKKSKFICTKRFLNSPESEFFKNKDTTQLLNYYRVRKKMDN